MWSQLAVSFAMLVAASVLSLLIAPRTPPQQPGRFSVPEIDPNRNLPIVFGTFLITDPTVAWYGDLSTKPIYSSGGKK